MLQESTNNDFFYKKIFCDTLNAEFEVIENCDNRVLI